MPETALRIRELLVVSGAWQLEASTDRWLLEDGTGVWLLG